MTMLPPIPLEPAVAWVIGAGTAATLGWWCWEESRRTLPLDGVLMRQQFRLCQICATLYPAAPEERLTICPQCGSYNSQEGARTP